MKKMVIVNLEEGYPSLKEALDILEFEISRAKKSNIGCFYIIHGYGSSGQGGIIKTRSRNYLKKMKEEGKIFDYVFGENFHMFNETARVIKDQYKELSSYYNKNNEGVIIVLVQKN